jgi:hypothetical protein
MLLDSLMRITATVMMGELTDSTLFRENYGWATQPSLTPAHRWLPEDSLLAIRCQLVRITLQTKNILKIDRISGYLIEYLVFGYN